MGIGMLFGYNSETKKFQVGTLCGRLIYFGAGMAVGALTKPGKEFFTKGKGANAWYGNKTKTIESENQNTSNV